MPYLSTGAECVTLCDMHLGEWLREARKAAGLSYAETTHRLRELPPPMWISIETIRRMEKKANPDPIHAAGLARVYGKEPDDWPAELRDAMDGLRKVLDPAVRRLLLETAGRAAA